MDEEYSYEIQRGRAFDEDPEFNGNYADQEVADHEALMKPEVERPVRVLGEIKNPPQRRSRRVPVPTPNTRIQFIPASTAANFSCPRHGLPETPSPQSTTSNSFSRQRIRIFSPMNIISEVVGLKGIFPRAEGKVSVHILFDL